MKLLPVVLLAIATVNAGAVDSPPAAASADGSDALGSYKDALSNSAQGAADTGKGGKAPPASKTDTVATPPAPPGGSPSKAAALGAVGAPESAAGKALLPDRSGMDPLEFANTPAAEIVLRMSARYRLSIVFSGDDNVRLTGKAANSEDPVSMARGVFRDPDWTVALHAGSLVIAGKQELTFRKISLTDLNPPEVSP